MCVRIAQSEIRCVFKGGFVFYFILFFLPTIFYPIPYFESKIVRTIISYGKKKKYRKKMSYRFMALKKHRKGEHQQTRVCAFYECVIHSSARTLFFLLFFIATKATITPWHYNYLQSF